MPKARKIYVNIKYLLSL